ncbi:hypothetical protein PIB30_051176 [Stylosanthes scabra]|uniref:Uncharacterized protein n=1 Tax=Stylosanthes scabra TaxID=79078 RepID=A0ABU6UH79_9FABA|nr:hypothetical protein [Stylosanthes scabra]
MEPVEGDVFMRAYYNGEIISHTAKGVTFVCQNPLSSIIRYTMTFAELQNVLCGSIQSHISKRVSNILFRIPVVLLGGVVQFQTMRIYNDTTSGRNGGGGAEHTQLLGLENDVDIEDEFKANYELSDDNEDGDNVDNPVLHEAMRTFIRNDSFGIPSMMRDLSLDAMNLPPFPEYVTIRMLILEVWSFMLVTKHNTQEGGELSV